MTKADTWNTPIWVIKIGGSLLGSKALVAWLDLILAHGNGQVIIVPGGGVFADAVREAQQTSGVSDATAHQLALRAMDQYGLLLAGLNEAFTTAKTELEIAERSWQHRGIIWLPSQMLQADESIAQNWDVTSDSLSAWLANRLNAEHLLIVKSKTLSAYAPNTQVSVGQLINQQVLDTGFRDFVQESKYRTWILNN